MKIITPSVELVNANVPAYDRAKHVELCGRVCYKSEDKITDDSAEKFIAGIIRRGHEAVLEHARITLDLTKKADIQMMLFIVLRKMQGMGIHDYMTITSEGDRYIVSGNMRAWRGISAFATLPDNPGVKPLSEMLLRMIWAENPAFFPEYYKPEYADLPDMLLDVSPEDYPFDRYIRYKHSWYTLRFICDRGISHEIVRHRPASYCQESSRYNCYSNAKFGNEITVIKPCFLNEGTESYLLWKSACRAAENAYMGMLDEGCSAQEARDVLPTSTKTELVMTATADEWVHFLSLRTSEAAHPQMREVAYMAQKVLAAEDEDLFGSVK